MEHEELFLGLAEGREDPEQLGCSLTAKLGGDGDLTLPGVGDAQQARNLVVEPASADERPSKLFAASLGVHLHQSVPCPRPEDPLGLLLRQS